MPQNQRLKPAGHLPPTRTCLCEPTATECIVVPYRPTPQPPSRVVRLTPDDITRADQQPLLKLGEPPPPAPEPPTKRPLRRTAGPDNMNTTANHATGACSP